MDVAKLQNIANTAPPGALTYTVFNALMDQLIEDLQQELIDQGHKLTGTLINSMTKEVEVLANSIVGYINTEDYGAAVDTGVKASKIPYSRGSGAGTSKYIDGLINFWRIKGLTEDKARSAAFATAEVHKKQGMPTKDSLLVSKEGRRTGFVGQVIDNVDISNTLDLVFEKAIQNLIDGE